MKGKLSTLLFVLFSLVTSMGFAEEVLRYKPSNYPEVEYDISASAADFKKLKSWIQEENIGNKKSFVAALKKSDFSNLTKFPALIFNSLSEEKENVSPDKPRAILHSGRLFVGISGHLGADEAIPLFDWNPTTFKFESHLIEFKGGQAKFTDNPSSCMGCHGSPFRPIWGNYSTWIGAYGSDSDDIKFGPALGGSSRAAFSRLAEEEFKNYEVFLKKHRDSGIYSYLSIPSAEDYKKEMPGFRLTFHLYHLHYKSILRELFCTKPISEEQKTVIKLILKNDPTEMTDKKVVDLISSMKSETPVRKLEEFQRQFQKYQDRYTEREKRDFKIGTPKDEDEFYLRYAEYLRLGKVKTDDGLSYEDYAKKLLVVRSQKHEVDNDVRKYALLAYALQSNTNVVSWFIDSAPGTGAKRLLLNAGAGVPPLKNSHMFNTVLLDAIESGFKCPEEGKGRIGGEPGTHK